MSATARQRVLEALQRGPKTTAELCHPTVGGERFGARIQELRAAGHRIRSRRLRTGSWGYELLPPKPATATPAAASRDDGESVTWLTGFFCTTCRRTFERSTYPCPHCGEGILVRVGVQPAAVPAVLEPA